MKNLKFILMLSIFLLNCSCAYRSGSKQDSSVSTKRFTTGDIVGNYVVWGNQINGISGEVHLSNGNIIYVAHFLGDGNLEIANKLNIHNPSSTVNYYNIYNDKNPVSYIEYKSGTVIDRRDNKSYYYVYPTVYFKDGRYIQEDVYPIFSRYYLKNAAEYVPYLPLHIAKHTSLGRPISNRNPLNSLVLFTVMDKSIEKIYTYRKPNVVTLQNGLEIFELSPNTNWKWRQNISKIVFYHNTNLNSSENQQQGINTGNANTVGASAILNKELNQTDSWRARIKLHCLEKGKVCGTINFNSLGCGGNLTFIGPSDNGYLFNENLNYGRCASGCQIWVNKDGGSYKEICNNSISGGGKLF